MLMAWSSITFRSLEMAWQWQVNCIVNGVAVWAVGRVCNLFLLGTFSEWRIVPDHGQERTPHKSYCDVKQERTAANKNPTTGQKRCAKDFQRHDRGIIRARARARAKKQALRAIATVRSEHDQKARMRVCVLYVQNGCM
jgi:hypothetical protein